MVALSACAHPIAPRVAPAAATDVAAASPVAAQAMDTNRAAPSMPPAVPDSVEETLRLAMRTLELFGDSAFAARVGSDSAEPGDAGAAEPVDWDIEVSSFVTHRKVDHYVKLFTGSARDRFSAWMTRGSRYEPMIRATFRAHGIPEDLYYLGAVESGYDPQAVSRAYAVGMWQFMTSTAKGFGLRVDWWMDERRDPVKSTDAAARFLAELEDQFGSFYLAAAAYNGGPGRVKRGLARYADDLQDRTGEDAFFALAETGYLRNETENYVPQLIAAAYVAKDPPRFDLTLGDPEPYAYDSVRVPEKTPMAIVARAAGATLDDIRDLNPFILRGMTPPDGPVFVRVPPGRAAAAALALELWPDSERVAFTTRRTRKGETMARIASGAGISVRQLAWYNPKVKSSRGALRTGTVINVPTRDVVEAAFDVPDPAIERYGSSGGGRGVHIVRRGESLSQIAVRYRTSVSTLVRINGLKKQVIYPGQRIMVSGAPRRSTSAKRTTASSQARPKGTKKAAPGKKAASQ